MRKLKLELEELKVESLEMDAGSGRPGTVNGRAKAYETEIVACPTEGETEAEGCIPDEVDSVHHVLCPSFQYCTGVFTC